MPSLVDWLERISRSTKYLGGFLVDNVANCLTEDLHTKTSVKASKSLNCIYVSHYGFNFIFAKFQNVLKIQLKNEKGIWNKKRLQYVKVLG